MKFEFMKKKRILYLTLALFGMIFFFQGASAQICSPDYSCGGWTECDSGLQTRVCEDLKCGADDITERRFCGDACIPRFECGSWSSCTFLDKYTSVFESEQQFIGYRERLCTDTADCVEDFYEEERCKRSYPINLEERVQCGISYLFALDPSTDRPIARFNLDLLRKTNDLDIVFTQGDVTYCESCYNGLLDEDEEKVDCGGNCKPCIGEDESIKYESLSVLAVAVFLTFFMMFYYGVKNYLAR